jgi:PAS domain S-box-containing protein
MPAGTPRIAHCIYAHAPVGLCVIGKDFRYLRINKRLAEFNGVPVQAHLGRTVREVVPVLADQSESLIETIVRTGEPILNVEFEGETPAQPGAKRSWISHWSPLKDENGRVTAVNVVVEETTERRQQEEQQRILVRELTHRSKNLLSVVQAIVRQTARHAGGVEEFTTQLDSRIEALSQAHDLLIEQNWRGAALEDLVAGQLYPFVESQIERVAMSGPSLFLHAQATQHLALALHELATNACKHGALSVPSGTVRIDWNFEIGDGGRKKFSLRWAEQGGPAVRLPKRRGFGTLVLERLTRSGLGGCAELSYGPEGFRWDLSIENAEFCR